MALRTSSPVRRETPPLLTGTTIHGRQITYHVHPALRSLHVEEDLWIRYPEGVDLSAVPEEVLLLPAAYHFGPLAWAFGRRFAVPTLEERALDSFDGIRAYLRKIYPGLAWDGEILATRTEVITPMRAPAYDAAALFTGGVDSTYTILAHEAERLLWVNIWEARTRRGAPNAAYRAWLLRARASAEAIGHHLSLVETNAWRVVDRKRVGEDLSRHESIRSWWADVHFGMVLTSLVAPLLYHFGIPLLYIGGGGTAERMEVKGLPPNAAAPEEGTAGTPNVDDRITLGPANVKHDGLRATRQRKIDHIVVAATTPASVGFPLRVCLIAPYDAEGNCGNCEKCLRTINSIVVAGGNPRRFGFGEYRRATLRLIRQRFESGRMPLSPVRALMWQASQPPARIRLDEPRDADERSYLRWLSDFDFGTYTSRQVRRRRLGILRRIAAIPFLPSAYLKLRILLARWAARLAR